ncbi:methyltransferase domain-containing protein [Nocardioides sp. dk4132]|uniref:class I SAM-dependent methyltransferase n=1 Tax=unclassified Nocardioides TaxID=2615069 RepID=UPI001294F6C5|nr:MULTISPECIES: class I SAM-dependent methyltransferase [unclassified Nocardioides]MQW76182.1 methyltransferase domain-containing protein [Nocardioides sp. dk4132]QGA09013.1 methyltransferase domain-containing protein [Nocardioides sp. dk884]
MTDQSSPRPRWFTDTKDGHSQWYVERFRALAAEGADLAGEARFVDAMVERGARILDAGCGTGRLSGELAARGHTVVGLDADPVLVEAARVDHPGPTYGVVDLSELELADVGGEPVDLVVCAGNVMVFVAPGTERQVLANLCAVVRPGGRVVVGFRRDEAYPFERYDADLADLAREGVARVEQRFATWHLDPFTDESDFAVTVLRVG